MSTMAPEATVVVSASPLITRFWLKLQAKAIAAGGTVTGPIRNVLNKLFSWVPAPVKALAGPVLMLTPFGYDSLWGFITAPVRVAWWALKAGARLAHKALNWAGDRVVDVVAAFSVERSCQLADQLAKFSDLRAKYAVSAQLLIAAVGNEVMIAIAKPGPMVATMAAAGFAVLTIAMKMVFPATFASMLFHLPVGPATFLATVSLGGWAAFNPIALISIAAVGVVLALGLFARTPKIIDGEPVIEQEKVIDGEIVTTTTALVPTPAEDLVEIEIDGKLTKVTRQEAADALNKAADLLPNGPGHQQKAGNKGHKNS